MAKRLATDRRKPQPEEECCERAGILWDLVAVYPVDPIWTDRLPIALMFNGPVVDVQADLEASLASLGRLAPRRSVDRLLVQPATNLAVVY